MDWERQTRDALENLRAALEALKRDVLPLNERRYQIMAEPVVDMIGGLEKELRERQEKTARDCVDLVGDLLPRWVELAAMPPGLHSADHLQLSQDLDRSHRLFCALYGLQRLMIGAGFEFKTEPITAQISRAQFVEQPPGQRSGWCDHELLEVAIYEAARQALGPVEGVE